VATGFGRYGMLLTTSDDTGTAFCFRNSEEADEMYRWCELV